MEKTSVLGELLYVGFVFEKGRCTSTGIWGIGKRKSMYKHFCMLNLLVQAISSGEITQDDHDILNRFFRFIREDCSVGRHYPIQESMLIQSEKCICGVISTIDINKMDSEVNSLMRSITSEVLVLLEKRLFVQKKRICILIRALHNLPRVYLGPAGQTLCNLNQPEIGNDEAIRYSLSYLDEKTRESIGY